MTTVKNIYNYIDSFAPFNTAESYDNVGILVGDPEHEVKKALVSLDITAEVVSEAAEIGAELIISHHPVIFNPIKKVPANSVVYKLIENKITAICAHTNLDKSLIFGVNTELATAIDLENIRVGGNSDIFFLGDTKAEFTSEKFAELIKKKLNCDKIIYTSFNNHINKVGLCSGAGGSEVFSAIREGCDAFVTGELKHHELLSANERGVSVFVLGHYKSEDVVIEPLCEKISEHFNDVVIVKSKTFSDMLRFI